MSLNKIFGDEGPTRAPRMITTRTNQYLFYRCQEKLFLQKGEDRNWEEARVISPRVDKFVVTLDTGFRPHLVVIDRGDLFHLTSLEEKDAQLKEQPIFKEEGRTCRNLLLSGDSKGGLHLLYSASDPDKTHWWLLHHYYDGNRWLEPRVVDFGGAAAENPGCLAADQTGNLHLVYTVDEGDNTRLYYRYFSLSTLSWDRAFPVSGYGGPRFPNLVVDRQQNLHLLWSSRQDGHYYINYRQLTAGGWPSGGWRGVEVISPPLGSPAFPLLNYREETITAGWVSGGKFWQSMLVGREWHEKIGGQEIPGYMLIFSCHPVDWESPPATAWILGQGPLPQLELVAATAPQQPGWDPYFKELNLYSKHLIHRASELTATKGHLERSLEAKQREMFWMSQHKRKKIGALTQSLQQKNRELQELEEKLQQTIDSLKNKTEKSRREWHEKKKSYQLQVTQKEEESRQLKQMLLEKENTIARSEARIQELQKSTLRLQKENQLLQRRLEQSSPGIRKWLGKVFQPRQ